MADESHAPGTAATAQDVLHQHAVAPRHVEGQLLDALPVEPYLDAALPGEAAARVRHEAKLHGHTAGTAVAVRRPPPQRRLMVLLARDDDLVVGVEQGQAM
ncbi:MAG: hypothetical protein LH603_05835 [Pseudonocardia sp.]|nr:hypothetical protein [Pseudonocardia sp.]